MAASEEAQSGLKRKLSETEEDILAPLVGKAREFKIKREPEPGKVFQSGVGIGVFVTNPKHPGAVYIPTPSSAPRFENTLHHAGLVDSVDVLVLYECNIYRIGDIVTDLTREAERINR
jgi:hypothetical protein